MDEDLDSMSQGQLIAEAANLRNAIRRHRDSTGHELCWHHPNLWSLLPEGAAPAIVVPAWPQFMRGCLRYRQSLDEQAPGAPRTNQEFDANDSVASFDRQKTVCWSPVWNEGRRAMGLEHLLLAGNTADSSVLAFSEAGAPFRLAYRLTWDDAWRLHDADLFVAAEGSTRSLDLRTDGEGRWRTRDGSPIDELDGCIDIDIWPTPFTNSFPIRRNAMSIGQRCEFRMAWVFAPDLTVRPQRQAYTRLADRLYRFESLDGSGFKADLPVDDDGVVLDYPDLFERVHPLP
jgi:hypothetical protein